MSEEAIAHSVAFQKMIKEAERRGKIEALENLCGDFRIMTNDVCLKAVEDALENIKNDIY